MDIHILLKPSKGPKYENFTIFEEQNIVSIQSMYPFWDPFSYPYLFDHGESGRMLYRKDRESEDE